jgi:hypothetical protein
MKNEYYSHQLLSSGRYHLILGMSADTTQRMYRRDGDHSIKGEFETKCNEFKDCRDEREPSCSLQVKVRILREADISEL